MKNILNILLLNLLLWSISFAQTGDRLRAEGKLEAAVFAYGAQFMQNPTDQDVVYKLASTLSLIYQTDTAYFFLKVALRNNNSLRPLADSDFLPLMQDPRWKEIESMQFEKYQAKHGQLQQPEYARKLLRLIIKDQALDYYVDQSKVFFAKNGYVPHWYYPLGAYKQRLSIANFAEMQALIAKYGWPTYSTVGHLAADALLLIINHHQSDDVRKQYITQIKEACLNGEGSCMEYAKIQDRILVNEGKKQRYGMQFKYNKERKLEPFPIYKPSFVDQRRKAIGLEPLQDYLKRKINYVWTIEQKTN